MKPERQVVRVSREEVRARGVRRYRKAWRHVYHLNGALTPSFSKLKEARAWARAKWPKCVLAYAWKESA